MLIACLAIAAPVCEPVHVATVVVEDVAMGVAVEGEIACVAARFGGLRVVGVGEGAPREVAFVPIDLAWDVAISGGVAFVAAGGEGVYAVDLADPGAPVVVSKLALAGMAMRVEAHGDVVVVMLEGGGAAALDVSDAEAMRVISTVPGTFRAVEVDHDQVFGVDASVGLRVLDGPQAGAVVAGTRSGGAIAATATNIVLGVRGGVVLLDQVDVGIPLSWTELDGEVRDVAAWQHTVVATTRDRVLIVDVSNPLEPVVCGWHDGPVDGRGAAVVGDMVYVADGGAGLKVFDIAGCAPCAADINGDGRLDVLDFAAFQVAWNVRASCADRTGDGAWTVADITRYQLEYVSACN